MVIEWNDALLTGHELVDGQHKELFARLNRLIEAVWGGKGTASATEVLGFLEEYVVEHFGEEEHLMVRYNYPSLEAHRALHQAFVARFLEIKNQFASEGMDSDLALTVMREVTEWLQNHIRNVDRKMVEFVRSCSEHGTEPAMREALPERTGKRTEAPPPEVSPSQGSGWSKMSLAALAVLALAALAWSVRGFF